MIILSKKMSLRRDKKIIFFLIIPILLQAQNSQYTEKEKLQGYKQTDDQLIFLFDESMYNVNPVRVIVEGSMRNWDHSLDDSDWWLKKQNGNTVWTLTIQNPEYRTIPPGTAFKYRINDGDWINPPENAPNI